MVAVAVTEPDFGSDVAGVKVTATAEASGWVINGVKTWCTFAARADILMLLARTDPDRSKSHRGLSMFIVPKPQGDGRRLRVRPGRPRRVRATVDSRAGRSTPSATGACTPTSWPSTAGGFPDDCLIGGEAGQGKGFYYQMEGFENGRLQTAARALGVMQAAYEAARDYAVNRVVFGRPISEYQLTQAKLGRHGRAHPGLPPVHVPGGHA